MNVSDAEPKNEAAVTEPVSLGLDDVARINAVFALGEGTPHWQLLARLRVDEGAFRQAEQKAWRDLAQLGIAGSLSHRLRRFQLVFAWQTQQADVVGSTIWRVLRGWEVEYAAWESIDEALLR